MFDRHIFYKRLWQLTLPIALQNFMDAAVGSGNLDLRLRNVLPYDIEIRLETQDGVMCVRIYRCAN